MHEMRLPLKVSRLQSPTNRALSYLVPIGTEVATLSTRETLQNMKKLGKGISGALLSLAFVFGIAASTIGTAQAQYRDDDGYYRHGDSKDERKARKRELKRRRKEARRAARHSNNQDDWRRDRDQNRSNDVYNNNGRYGRNDGYGNNGGYNQVERDRGYQQGLNTGASDGQRGQSYNPQRSTHFKNASSEVFRQGFVQGYDQGFRQYSGNGNQRNRTNNGGWGSVLGGILGQP